MKKQCLTYNYLRPDGTPVLMRRFFNVWLWPWKEWEVFSSRKHAAMNKINELAHKLEDAVHELNELEAQEREVVEDINNPKNETKVGESPRRYMSFDWFGKKPNVINKPTDSTWEDYYQFVLSGQDTGTFAESVAESIGGVTAYVPGTEYSVHGGRGVAQDCQVITSITHEAHRNNNRRNKKGNGNQQNN